MTDDHARATEDRDPGTDLATLRADLIAHLEWRVAEAQQTTVKEMASLDYLNRTLQPSAFIPAAGGWAASYEIIATLVARVLASKGPTRYLEVGSGVSTIWLGLAMKCRGDGSVTSFEHDPDFHRRVVDLVGQHGLDDVVEVVLAPLTSQSEPGTPDWYDIDDWAPAELFDVLFVDGPPGTTGSSARYSAYPRLAPFLSDGALVVLDDVHRPDEAAIATRWQSLEVPGHTLVHDQRVGRSALMEFRSKQHTEDPST
ncbi:O-methyltransferase [Terrabacter sp. AAH1]